MNDASPMRVFLAGATGFVGGGILARLKQHGHSVTALVRDPARLPPSSGVTPLGGDLTRPGPWQDGMRGHDAAVNAVGILREGGRNTFQGVVVDGTWHFVEAATRAGVRRLVQISANGIDAAQVPYQTTKLEAERIVTSAGIPWTILRPSLVFGDRDRSIRLYARLMRRFRVLPYFGRGDYRLAPVAVEDVGEAVARSLERPEAQNQAFTLCGPQTVTYKEFLREIRDAAGTRCLIPWAPRWSGLAAAALFGRFSWFPADRDAMKMLFMGNVCADDRWRQLFGIRPVGFREGIRRYLGRSNRTAS